MAPAPASPLESDDLLSEILLSLPPSPSSLPRASLVCKRWRRLVTDPGFHRRFRARHHRSPPLLGFFFKGERGLSFTPTLEPPDRIPPDSFSLQLEDVGGWEILCCRHGLVLLLHRTRLQILVWDPVAGDLIRIAIPAGLDNTVKDFKGAVLRSSGDVHRGDQTSHFQVILVCKDEQCARAFACVYSSESGVWGNLISTDCPSRSYLRGPGSTLVGGSLYWLIDGKSLGVLVLDLGRRCLAVIDVPSDVEINSGLICWIVPFEGGLLGFLHLSGFSIQLWERKTGFDGVARWVVGGTIELDKLLLLSSGEWFDPMIIGFFEDDNVLLVYTGIGFFMVQLGSLQFKRIPEKLVSVFHHAFASVYTAGI